MRLIETLRPLLENRVQYITDNQWAKIFAKAYVDDSLSVTMGIYEKPNIHSTFYLSDLMVDEQRVRGLPIEAITPEFIRKFDEQKAEEGDVEGFRISSGEIIHHRDSTLEGAIRHFVHQIVQFMADNISKKHLQWVVNRYIKDDFMLAEDYEMVHDTLTMYDRYRREIDVPQLTKSLSYQELFHKLEKFIDAEEQELRDAREKRLVADGELEISFYQDKTEYVAIPKTFEASKHLSKPNGWCTQSENWFISYTEDDQVLYFFRHQGRPYLVHFESKQFMGKANEPFDVKEMRESSPAFQWIIEQKKKEVENMTSGDPSDTAYFMVRGGLAEPQWAMRVMENDNIGHPSHTAFYMVEHGYAEPEWAMNVIENAETGDPSNVAYAMVESGYTKDVEWAMEIIENDKIGYPLGAARLMLNSRHVSHEWYEKIREKYGP